MHSYSRNWEVGSIGVGAGLYMYDHYDVVLKEFTFAISSPGEFLLPAAFRAAQSAGI